MKKIFIIGLAMFASTITRSQVTSSVAATTIDTAAIREQHWKEWLGNLYEIGVVKEKDSVKISAEAMQVISDSNLRKALYPANYTWQAANYFLKQLELKKGFWYLINLYAADTANKKMVVESLVQFDQVMDMERILVSTFYTYALLDPSMAVIKAGRPVIIRPDLLEKKFSQMKEIVAYVDYFRKQRTTTETAAAEKPAGK